MKTASTSFFVVIGLLLSLELASAQLAIPSDGSDGALVITQTMVIDLSSAVTGRWDADNSASAGKGIYDPDKWAIVFKYQSVNIAFLLNNPEHPEGPTVTFKNHPSHAPVVWLVQGDVAIDGILDLSGQNGQGSPSALVPAEPGPGGFRGGAWGPQGVGPGYGPGAGAVNVPYGGGYDGVYGNPQILPLIGGSGGNGGNAAGGGAILIAVAGRINLNGSIVSRSGNNLGNGSTGGSGGAVKLIANEVSGVGQINCFGFPPSYDGPGRIRVETLSLGTSIRTSPETIGVPPATPPTIWPPASAPKARIVSVDAVNSPSDPTAPLINSADIGIQNDNPVTIVVETRDFPIEGVVDVRIAQKFGVFLWQRAHYVSGSQSLATWSLSTTLSKGFTTLQARATAP